MIGVVLIGKSNSGKSAIGKKVANKLGMRYISSGDIARSMDNIQDSLDSGEMAPEDKMRSAVLNKIISCNISYILDGFPRFHMQYTWLKRNFKHRLIFVHINTPDADVISRAKERHRSDDNSIYKKLQYFNEHTEPMLWHMATDGEQIHHIDNGNNVDINNSINKLIQIVERYKDAHDSEI